MSDLSPQSSVDKKINQACQLLEQALGRPDETELESLQQDVNNATDLVKEILDVPGTRALSRQQLDRLNDYLQLSQQLTAIVKARRTVTRDEFLKLRQREKLDKKYENKL